MRLFTLTLALTCVLFAALCSASAIPAYTYARALDIRDATPVVGRRASPSPSPSPRPHADRLEALEILDAIIREPRVPTRGKLLRRNVDDEIVLSPAQLSGHLCPRPMSVCPITSTAPPRTLGQWIREGFECVDTHEDLTSCGGCGILDKNTASDVHDV
ncbi:hypothetical protein EIP86_007728 [Pleurotus ostreatoroseus]|nr:hypothetical protein EIP86_007728 [Pleurotus ostreatoroseus]